MVLIGEISSGKTILEIGGLPGADKPDTNDKDPKDARLRRHKANAGAEYRNHVPEEDT
jgi:hypothetical protein